MTANAGPDRTPNRNTAPKATGSANPAKTAVRPAAASRNRLALERSGRLIWPVLVLLAVLAPFSVGSTTISAFSDVVILAVMVMSLNVLTGMNGQASIGQGAFMGLAAYATA